MADFLYTAGFAAKTAIILAKDLETGGTVGIDYITCYIDGTINITMDPFEYSIASTGYRLEVTADPEWLTADGVSESRIMAVVTEDKGGTWEPVEIEDWRGGKHEKVITTTDYDDEHIIIKEERMPDGKFKLILQHKETGKVTQVIK